MQINVLLRQADADKGVIIGTADPSDDFEALIKRVREYGVGGEVVAAWGQFVADERGAGFEIGYSNDPSDTPTG